MFICGNKIKLLFLSKTNRQLAGRDLCLSCVTFMLDVLSLKDLVFFYSQRPSIKSLYIWTNMASIAANTRSFQQHFVNKKFCFRLKFTFEDYSVEKLLLTIFFAETGLFYSEPMTRNLNGNFLS